MENRNYRFYWHVHHNKLLEFMEIAQERIDYIKKNKPSKEIAIRIKLMTPVRGKLPKKLVAARVKLDAAQAKRDAVWGKKVAAQRKVDAAWAKLDAVWGDPDVVEYIKKLHEQECPNCSWDGETIFPKKKRSKK